MSGQMSAARDSDILTAALRYAARGWPVFPCSPEHKRPLVPTRGEQEAGWCLIAGERRDLTEKGSGGFKLATTDEATIRDWWKRWPQAMIGMPTGRAKDGVGAHVMVVDLDPKIVPASEMLKGLAVLCNGNADVPLDVPMVRTQSGGLHLWFAYPDIPPRQKPNGEMESDNRAGLFAHKSFDGIVGLRETIREHVDIRGDGGYVILPPSRMNSGKTYEWERASFAPKGTPLPALPTRILDAVLKRGEFAPKAKAISATALARREDADSKITDAQRKYAANAMLTECNELAATPPGRRHDALNKAAYNLGTLVGAGVLGEGTARGALQDAAQWAGSVFSKKEADTIDDGLRDGAARPRDMSDVGKRAGRSAPSPKGGGKPKTRGSAAASSLPSGEGALDPSEAGPPTPGSDESSLNPHQENEGSGQPDAVPEGVQGGLPVAEGGGGGGFRNDDLGDGDEDPERRNERIVKCLWLPLNDTGNAERLLIHFGANILNVREVGLHWWTGTHWQLEGGDEFVMRCAQEVAELIEAETDFMVRTLDEKQAIADGKRAEQIPVDERSEEDRDAIGRAAGAKIALSKRKAARRKFAVSCGNVTKTKGMIVQALPHRTVAPEDMDRDPMRFNVLNGTFRFRRLSPVELSRGEQSVTLHPHRRTDFITKMSPAVYDPDASAPHWRAFLDLFQPETWSQLFLQTYGGYSLTGLTDEQVLVYLYGRGANGKSTFAEAILRLMGDYGRTLNPESVSGDGQRRGDQATPEIAQLPGARMVVVSELPKGASIREALVKALTGGERLQARHLHKGFFDFYPSFKGWMSGNDMPKIAGTDDGIWRRILIVLWPVMLEKEKRRKLADVLAEFEAERSGILNWLLDGLRVYLEDGLKVPDEVRKLTDGHRSETDIVGEFLAACVNQTGKDDDLVQAKVFYEAFIGWCEQAAKKPVNNTVFGNALKSKGWPKDTMGGRIFYQGAKLLHNFARSDEPPPADEYPDGPG